MEYEEIAKGATAVIYKIDSGRVLKKFTDSRSDASIDNEYFCSKTAESFGIGAPKVYERINDSRGRGIVMEYVCGDTLLDMFISGKYDIDAALRILAKCQCRINACDGTAFPKARDIFPGRIRRSSVLSAGAKEKLTELIASLPAGGCVCHTDLHPGNIIMSASGARIIDWCDTTCAPAWADVARTVMFFYRESVVYGGSELKSICKYARDIYPALYSEYSGLAPEYLDQWMALNAASRIDGENEADRDRIMAVIEKVL